MLWGVHCRGRELWTQHELSRFTMTNEASWLSQKYTTISIGLNARHHVLVALPLEEHMLRREGHPTHHIGRIRRNEAPHADEHAKISSTAHNAIVYQVGR